MQRSMLVLLYLGVRSITTCKYVRMLIMIMPNLSLPVYLGPSKNLNNEEPVNDVYWVAYMHDKPYN